LNSIDRKWRDERDILVLLDICEEATATLARGDIDNKDELRRRFEGLRDRRQLEDEGRATV